MTDTAPDNLTRLCRALYNRDDAPADYLGGPNAKMLGDAADKLELLDANNVKLAHEYANVRMDAYNQTKQWRKALEFYANANSYRKPKDNHRKPKLWELAQQALAEGLPAEEKEKPTP